MASIANPISTNYRAKPVFSVARTPSASLRSRLAATLRLWGERFREREALGALTDRELRDIGLSRGDVYAELAKPFWRG